MTASDITSTVAQIAATLNETTDPARRQIAQVVALCGVEQALAWLTEAQQAEASGGLMTCDGSRRRTPGGTFFYIVRGHLLKTGRRALAHQIFHFQAAKRPRKAAPATPAPALPIVSWSKRGEVIAIARQESGKATTVKVTIIGKPGKIVERQNFTLLMLKHAGPLPPLPKGIPVPNPIPETTYIVYIGARQWRKVAPVLQQNANDMFIVEGVQLYDAEYQAITVFATSITTKAIQQAARQSRTTQEDQPAAS